MDLEKFEVLAARARGAGDRIRIVRDEINRARIEMDAALEAQRCAEKEFGDFVYAAAGLASTE